MSECRKILKDVGNEVRVGEGEGGRAKVRGSLVDCWLVRSEVVD